MKLVPMYLCAVAMAAASLCAQAATPDAPKEPMDLHALLESAPKSADGTSIPKIRYNAIRETAVTYGTQAGLARRNFENQTKLEHNATNLDQIYAFQALLLEGNVVPPVLTETSDVYDQSSDEMLRVIGKVYRIEQQARFAYAPPTWRAYLLSSYDFDPNLVAAVAPQNDAERTLWREGVEEGFNIGSEQADDILKQNLAVLNRDFVGMVLYHRMLDSGMVTKPYVAANRTNVNKSTDGSMHIGEVFMRITANPEFVATEGKWKTGPRSMVQERLQRMLDPDQAKAMQQEAVNSGRVSEVGGR